MKRGVTADTALRLAQFFKTMPQFWMHMQANSNRGRPWFAAHAEAGHGRRRLRLIACGQ